MNINWVIADSTELDPMVDLNQLKSVGSFWGSWRIWRSFQLDNVVCYDRTKIIELVKRQFHLKCNFYIPNSTYQEVEQPQGVKIFEGEFVHDIERHEEIIALHLAASVSDIVLLVGFDFREPAKNPDKLKEHRAHNYRCLVKEVIKNNQTTQWVLINHPDEIMKDYKSLDNLTQDTLSNAVTLIG
jgi:hypothetical protein